MMRWSSACLESVTLLGVRGSKGCGVTAICKGGSAVEESAVCEAEGWVGTPWPAGPRV